MKWEYAKIFISSSFIDMHAERDYLIKKVFPELEERCEKYKIHLSTIDLRWGVPEDVSNSNSTIEKCLLNVDESRPFFLCFLAQRRGWIPSFKNYISQKINLNGVDELSFDYSTENKGNLKVFIDDNVIFDEKISNDGDSLKWNHASLDVSSYDDSVTLKFVNFFESELNFSDTINLKNITCSSNSNNINTSDIISNHDFNEKLRFWKTFGSVGIDEDDAFLKLKGSDISKKTADRYENIKNFEKRSATEMEIEHALLSPLRHFIEDDNEFKEYDPTAHSLFFVRDKSSLKGISDAQKRVYTNYELVDLEKGEFIPGEYKDEECIEEAKIIDDLSDETKKIIEEAENSSQKIVEEIIECKEAEDKKDDVHIEITKYTGDWNPTLKIPEIKAIDRFKSNEWVGRLTNFKEVKENYADISLIKETSDIESKIGRDLKDVITEQLMHQLKLEYPENFKEVVYKSEEERILQEELNQQDNFAYINSKGYIPVSDDIDKLNKYVSDNDENRICRVSSEAGLGKTMLLAKFSQTLEEKFSNKSEDKENQKTIFKRFCGASNLSSKAFSLWDSIIKEAGIEEDDKFKYPTNVDELKKSMPVILDKISSKGDSVIIIDAVNQMPDGLDMLKWLPAPKSSNLKIIVSVKEYGGDEDYNSKLNIIKGRNAFCEDYSFKLEALKDNKCKSKIIKSYLENYLKELSDDDIGTICEFSASENPLFLKVLLSELRVFASFEELRNEIQEFIKNDFEENPDKENEGSPKTAFNHVLERLERDEDLVDGEPLVPLIFSLLANARVGLSRKELTDIIKAQKPDLDEEYIMDTVNVNLRQVKPFMARKEGRDDFFYESFKLAAQERYSARYIQENEKLKEYFTGDDGELINFNALLADYFLKDAMGSDLDDYKFKGQNIRSYNELPYHLNEARDFDRLEKTLSSYSFIKNKIELSDINNLIVDYQFKDFEDEKHPFLEGEEDHSIVLIGRALELSAPILADKKDQLSTQLLGRMLDLKDDEIIKPIIDEIYSEDSSNMVLKPKSSSLYSPKSPIIKRPKVNGTKAVSSIQITDDKLLILANEDGTLNLFDLENNNLEILEESDSNSDSRVIKIIPTEDNKYMLIASSDGQINKWDINNRSIFKGEGGNYPKINAEITDIYLSDTYGKIYASSHGAIFSIDVETKELREESPNEDISNKKYNQILVPRRNEAILVCDEREVDGWDVYEMRKAYNKHHQQNDEEESSTKLDSSEEIRFMGLNKRFLTLISENGQMKFWNTLKNSGGGESIDEAQVCSPNDKFMQAKCLEDENEIITISDMGEMRVWDIPQPRSPKFNDPIDILTGIKSPTAIDYYTDGTERWVIVGNENNDVSVIDLNKNIEENEAVRHAESVLSIKIDDNHMITASDNGEVFAWDIDSEEPINKFANEFRCNSISYNGDSNLLVLAGYKTDENDKKINKIATCNFGDDMWKAIEKSGENGEKEELIELNIEEYKSGMGEVIDVTQNPSGIVFIEKDKLTIGDNVIELSGTATAVSTKTNTEDVFVGFKDGKIVKYPENIALEHKVESPVTKIKVTGEKLIAGYEDGSLEVFDLDENQSTSLKGHEKEIINIYADDSQIISVSKDYTLKLWKNNQCKYTYYLDIYATAISVSGDKLVIGDVLGNVRFFEFKN